MPTYVPAITGKKTDASADLTPPKKAAPADVNVAGGGMGAANLSHSTATFATIAGRMRRLQNAKAGPGLGLSVDRQKSSVPQRRYACNTAAP